jgi:serine/threonine protein kinase
MSTLDETLRGAFARAGLVDVRLVDRRPLTRCFIGTHIVTDTEVFIKALHSESSDVQRNFAREIGILQTLNGRPGFPVLRAFVSTPEIKFHACEHLTAPRFDQLARDDKLDLDEIIRLARALAAWVQRLHALGYVHRDLSPDHVFAGDPVTAVDFGLAKRLYGLEAEDRQRCLGYDVQAFGLILWEMICGHPVFQ